MHVVSSSPPPPNFPDSLHPRPPTPPHISRNVENAAIDSAIDFLEDSLEVENTLKQMRLAPKTKPITTTPDRSSSPRTHADSTNAAKKVGFSSTPTYHEPRKQENFLSPVIHLQRRVRPAYNQKPLRSILKPGQIPAPLTPDDDEVKLCYFKPDDPGSFSKMIQSVLNSLASPRLDARLDAYLTLNGTLQQYEGIAEIETLASRMDELTTFVARDINWKDAAQASELNVVQQALKLAATIVSNRELCPSLKNEFRTLIVERSIVVTETPDVPKVIVKLHLFILGAQRFQREIFTHAKTDRLITALQTLEDKVSGNAAIATRLIIYNRLLDQARDAMLRRSSDWFQHVLHSMLSSQKDVRNRAIDLASNAALALGTEPSFSKTVRELFEIPMDENESQRYFEYFSFRLLEMYNDHDLRRLIPQIWACIVLCLRHKSDKGTAFCTWKRHKPWLAVVQKCLNSSDEHSKYQSTIAWNKLVFALLPDKHTPSSFFEVLTVPILIGLKKDGNDKLSKQNRQFASASYYNLLHYALRPGLEYGEIDHAWEVYVEKVIPDAMLRSEARRTGPVNACRILHGLLTPTPGNGVWNANVAMEQIQLKPAELPRVDPRWVRSRLGKVLRLLEPILTHSMWVEEEMATEVLDSTLHALFTTIAEAASQEVKTSVDLKVAVALLVNIFHRLWKGATDPPAGIRLSVFFNRYNDILTNAVTQVGATPFAEDILTRNNQDGIEAALTPSSRPSKDHSAPHAPLVSLFGLLYHPPGDFTEESTADSFADLASNILDLLGSTKSTATAKLALIKRGMHCWSSLYAANAQPTVVRILYNCIAEFSIRTLREVKDTAEGDNSQSAGLELRHALDILVAGLEHVSGAPECLTVVGNLLHEMASVAKSAAGAGGVVLAVVEPLAKEFGKLETSIAIADRLYLVTELLLEVTWPSNKQELAQSGKELWGMGLAAQKAGAFNPYEHLYKMLSSISPRAYDAMQSVGADVEARIAEYVAAQRSLVASCPGPLCTVMLHSLQTSLAVWVRDQNRVAVPEGIVSEKICETWATSLNAIRSIPVKDSKLLRSLEALLVAGFSSPRKAIVNATILFWNETFGSADSLDYPAQLQAVLRARLNETELVLPRLPQSEEDQDLPTLPEFYETQQDDATPRPSVKPSPARSTRLVTPAPPKAREDHTDMFKMPMAALSTSGHSPARPVSRSSARSTPKARLRHEDSQIQFNAIDTSPVKFNETQILTEHQKEVTERQQQNARMLGDISSTPAGKSSTPPVKTTVLPPRSVQKRLEFAAEVDENACEQPTPDPFAEQESGMSDDIQSSPTPSSTRGSDYNKYLLQDDQMDEAEDPPSSPPQAPEFDQMDTVESEEYHDATTIVDETVVDSMEDAQDEQPEEDDIFEYAMTSDLPEDSRQLRLEEEAAASAHKQTSRQSLPPGPFKRQVEAEAEKVSSGDDVSRVKNSFENGNQQTPSPAIEVPEITTKTGGRGRRKRKRASASFTMSKRRRSQQSVEVVSSPARFSRSQSQDDDDDDVGDEIVVAGSQNRPSPSPERAAADEDMTKPALWQFIGVQQPSKKSRKRGRGEKSRSPSTVAQEEAFAVGSKRGSTQESIEASTKKDLKRKASAHSESDVGDASDGAIEPDNRVTYRRQTLVAVVPTPLKSRGVQTKPESTSPSATAPSALLARMKSVVSDLREVELSAQEEQELDDMLFQTRQALYEAATRRRAKNG